MVGPVPRNVPPITYIPTGLYCTLRRLRSTVLCVMVSLGEAEEMMSYDVVHIQQPFNHCGVTWSDQHPVKTRVCQNTGTSVDDNIIIIIII